MGYLKLAIVAASFVAMCAAHAGALRSGANTDLCIAAKTQQSKARIVVEKCNSATERQQWTYDGGKRSFSIAAGQLCMDVEGGSRGPGAAVIVYACHQRANQNWLTDKKAIQLVGTKVCLAATAVAADAQFDTAMCSGTQQDAKQWWSYIPG